MLMKKHYKLQQTIGFLLLIILLKASVSVNGQEPASAIWTFDVDMLPATSGNISASETTSGEFKLFEVSTFTGFKCLIYQPPDSDSCGPDSYIQFKITPSDGFDFYLNSLTMHLSSCYNNIKIKVEYATSADFSAPLTLVPELNVSAISKVEIFDEFNNLVQNGSSLYLRIYFTYRSISTDYLKLYDFQVTGQTATSDNNTTSINYAQSGYCLGGGTADVTLTGTGGGTFSSTPGLVIDPGTGSINLATSQPGIYNVDYTCSGEVVATTSVEIFPNPNCAFEVPGLPVLPSSTCTFTAPAVMESYAWSVTGNGTITGPADAQTVTVEAGPESGTPFTLSLAVLDGNGCTNSHSDEIAVNEPDPGSFPTAVLSGTQSACAGGSADLTVNLTGLAPWTFTWFDGVNEHQEETYEAQHIITVYPTENTTYSLTGQVTDGSGNSNTATGEAKIYFGPITTAPKIMACTNTTVGIPVTVQSFNEVRDISLALQYDPTVMTYLGFESGGITFSEGEINNVQLVDNYNNDLQVITVSKTSGENLTTLQDGAVLLTLKFSYKGGNTNLMWIDAPDDSWCSYSFLNENETHFESEAFCDVPTEEYYLNGSVRQLSVSGTDVVPVPDISTITGTPVIIPVSVTYPDLEFQNVSSDVLTDARIIYGADGNFPAGASIFNVTYNGIPVLSSPFDIGAKSEVLLSEILGTAAKPLLNHSKQTVNWEFFVDGISSPISVPVIVEALAHTDLTQCVIVMDTETFTVTYADASLTVTEQVTVCEGESLEFTAEIGYPAISNMDATVKADAKISAVNSLPQGTIINWNYNSSTNGSFTLPSSTTEIMLSTIVGTLPSPLQGHSGTDIWSFEISNAGLMDDNIITIQAVALLDEEYYIHSEDQITFTVHPLPEITAATLLTSTDESNWTKLTGSLTTGYEMCADPTEDYHYLDINGLASSIEIIHDFEMNAFYLDVNSVPSEFDEYWNNKGVNASASGWQAVMWHIVRGELPMFYISYDGTDYKLIDGFQHLYYNSTGNLRISGDYPAGSYIFTGTVTSANGCVSEVISITLDLSSAPVITCPGNITKFNDPGDCGALVTFEASATGTPAPAIFYTLEDGSSVEPGDFFPVGTTSVTATAENDCKTVTCTFDVTVVDNEHPAITCPVSENINVKLTNINTYVHSGTGWNPSAVDNCSVSQYLCTLSGATTGEGETLDGVAFNLGTTTVTWKATDASGNSDECSFTVTVTGVLLGGAVKYYNNEETPLDNTTVSIRLPDTGDEVASAITNAAGEYSIANVGPGLYDVIISTEKPMRSINSTDAGQVNAWNIAITDDARPSIEKVRFLAGDVNEDGFAESGDGAIIQNYFLILGSEQLFHKPWVFWKTNDAVTIQQTTNLLQINITTTSSDMNLDFYGLVCGDFNRSNIPATSSMNGFAVKSARAEEGSVFLQKGEVLLAEADNITELPILAASAMQVGAISLILDFPASQFEVMDVYLNDDAEKSAGFNVIDNMLVIGWNSVNPLTVEAGEPLVTLCLKVKDGESGMLYSFDLAPNPLNELADENMEAIDNASLIMDGLMIKKILTGIESTDLSGLTLTCWPNPFGEKITVRYILPASGQVNIDVTGVTGNSVSILSNQMQPAGEYIKELLVKDLVPGIYHITLTFKAKNGVPKATATTLLKH